jgi:hypothetical protein
MLVCAQLNSAVRHAIPLTRLCPVTRATAAQPHRSSSSASPFRLRHSPPWRVIGCRLAQRQRYTAVSVRADITTMDAPAFSADVTVDSIQALTASIKVDLPPPCHWQRHREDGTTVSSVVTRNMLLTR